MENGSGRHELRMYLNFELDQGNGGLLGLGGMTEGAVYCPAPR